MAIDSGLPILPIVISEYDFIDRKNKTFGSAGDPEVTLTILNPIETNTLTKDDINDLMTDTRNKMIQIFKQMKEIKYLKEKNKHSKYE